MDRTDLNTYDNYYYICEKYHDVSPFIILKIEAQRRGIVFSKEALDTLKPDFHQVKQRSISREAVSCIPVSLLMRDGTSIISRPPGNRVKSFSPPLKVDYIKGKLMLCDCGMPIEEVFFWEAPDYYMYYTSTGKPMWKIASARPQRIDINPYQKCDFWNNYGRCNFAK